MRLQVRAGVVSRKHGEDHLLGCDTYITRGSSYKLFKFFFFSPEKIFKKWVDKTRFIGYNINRMTISH